MTGVKTYVLFMVFSCAALLLNYHTQKEQSQIIRKHSATMLAPAILFLGIDVYKRQDVKGSKAGA